jgi:hypothetical protein
LERAVAGVFDLVMFAPVKEDERAYAALDGLVRGICSY